MSTGSGFRALATGISLLCASVGAFAGTRLDQEQARHLVESGEILPLARILQLQRAHLQGRLLDLELEREHGRLVYELELLGSDGVVRELEIDASSGALIRQEVED